MDETTEDPCDPEAVVNAFLQHKSMNRITWPVAGASPSSMWNG
jgi:hypothetical protein